MNMNLPNRLTLLRLVLSPLCAAAIVFPIGQGDVLWRIVAALLFAAASATDFLDGHIARREKIVTDFGKFMDPVADKILVLGSMLALLARYGENTLFARIFVWAVFTVLLRELVVTSLRMVAAQKSGVVIAAAWAGKVKTVSQIVCILVLILIGPGILAYLSAGFMTAMTLYSGAAYLIGYWPVLME
ncbi:MAG: CDP-diacylglycerol--glycerol-3-phosphate 3-phosphatidyltransferase [Oscillospiraceae bacterium]|nr:CDP-diacylglycerol--glycerol-3-phosphate 3-phosphatidyltransferase [Oscillospiraceae bacterium]